MVLYQKSTKHKNVVFPTVQFNCSVVTAELVRKLYDTAMEGLQKELLKAGGIVVDVKDLKYYSDNMIENYLVAKSAYWDAIKNINELMPALKVVVRSLERKYKDATKSLRQQGFIVNL